MLWFAASITGQGGETLGQHVTVGRVSIMHKPNYPLDPHRVAAPTLAQLVSMSTTPRSAMCKILGSLGAGVKE
jgi:hypothetical protein